MSNDEFSAWRDQESELLSELAPTRLRGVGDQMAADVAIAALRRICNAARLGASVSLTIAETRALALCVTRVSTQFEFRGWHGRG